MATPFPKVPAGVPPFSHDTLSWVPGSPAAPRDDRARRLVALALACLVATTPALAQKAHKTDKPATQPAPAPATPAPPPETKPYDGQLMRLAEILGALTYLRGLCGEKDSDQWRARMQALLDAEGNPAARKDRLAGAYNRGIQGYSLSYRTCTPNARVVIDRFLEEGGRIAKEVENRYHAT